MLFWMSTQVLSNPLLNSDPSISKQKIKNSVVSHLVKITSQIRKHYGWTVTSVLSPLINNTFPPSALNVFLNQWKHKGIQCTRDLFFEKAFTFTFQQLQNKFNMESKDLKKKYLRIQEQISYPFLIKPRPPLWRQSFCLIQ